MIFVLLVYVLFRRPLTFLILVGDIVGREEGVSQLSISEGASKDFILVQLKPMIKAYSSRRMVSTSGISDVVIASVHSEKTRPKKLMKMIIIMNNSQETTVFSGHQKMTSVMRLRPEK